MYHLWSAATQRPPWALLAALQSDESQVTSEDYSGMNATSDYPTTFPRHLTKWTYPVSAAVLEVARVLVEEVGQAGLVLHRDLVRGSLQQFGRTSAMVTERERGRRTPAAVMLNSGPVFWLS